MATSPKTGTGITRTLKAIDDEIKTIGTAFKSAQSAANNFAKALKIDPHNPALLKQYYAAVKEEIAACTSKIKLMEEKQNAMVAKNGEGVAKATSQYKELDSKIAATKAKIDELNSALSGSKMIDLSVLKAGLEKVAQTASKIVSSVKQIGESYAETSANIAKYSKMFDLSAESYQKQSYVWQQVTSDAEAYNQVMTSTISLMGKVSTGNQKVQTDLATLGLTLDDLKGKSSQEALTIVTDAISRLGTEAERQAASVALFGTTAGTYVTQMAETSTGALNEYNSEIQKTGVLTDDQVKKGQQLQMTFARIKQSIQVLVASIGESLIPLFESVADFVVAISPALTGIAKGLSAIGPAGVVAVGAFISVMSILPTLVATMAAFKYSLGDIGHATATLALLAAAVGIGAGVTTAAITAATRSSGSLASTTNTTYQTNTSNDKNVTYNYYNDNSTHTNNISKDVDADEVLEKLNEKYIAFKIGG